MGHGRHRLQRVMPTLGPGGIPPGGRSVTERYAPVYPSRAARHFQSKWTIAHRDTPGTTIEKAVYPRGTRIVPPLAQPTQLTARGSIVNTIAQPDRNQR